MLKKNRSERVVKRQQEAVVRTLMRSERSDAEQLAWLEERGHPNCKEAQSLRTKIGANMIRAGKDPFEGEK